MKLGILTEIGELADIFKKNLAYGKPMDYVNLGEELADVCWYVVNLNRFNNIFYLENDKPMYFSMGPLSNDDILSYLLNYQNDPYNVLNAMFNIAESFSDYGIEFYKCLENNINKLKIRFPDKFDSEKALNRDLESERKELEK